MKLWLCSANAVDYEPFGLVVADTVEEAKKQFSESLDNEDVWYTGNIFTQEINEVSGYKIALIKDGGKLPVGSERDY